MRIVLVGGGTGGHFYPLMAIAEALRHAATPSAKALELFYMGPDPYDAKALMELGIEFVSCPSGKQRRYRSILNILDPFWVIVGVIVALGKLFVLYPDAVMSKGGFTSVPVVIAAWLLRIPIVIHESDTSPGRANALGARFARYIAISYKDAAPFFTSEKTALTGIPIREEFLAPVEGDPKSTLGLDPALPVLLILGGSQGAERVNDLILDSLDELLPRFSVLHQTGAANFETVKAAAMNLVTDQALLSRYHPAPFMEAKTTLRLAYAAASIVISRAGSTTIFEIALFGKPSVIIPIPEEISHDQRTNAYAYARTGAAIVMEEGNLRDGLLVGELARIMEDKAVYEEMSAAAKSFAITDGAQKIADILYAIGDEHR